MRLPFPEHDTAELAKLLERVATQLSSIDATPAHARRDFRPPRTSPPRPPASHSPRQRPTAVAVGVASAAWLGPLIAASPNLGRRGYRSVSRIAERGRVVLDSRVRSWLGVADAAAFEVVVVRADPLGVLIVPVEDFDGRWQVLSP